MYYISIGSTFSLSATYVYFSYTYRLCIYLWKKINGKNEENLSDNNIFIHYGD